MSDEGRHIRAVLSGALDAVGLPTASADRTSDQDRADLGLPQAEKVCVVLVDGLGTRMLTERGGHAPFLRARLPEALTLASTFPSTTASALTALGTGELPGATGMLGFSLRDPVHGGLLNLISWENSQVRPREWQRVDTLPEQLAGRGEATSVVGVGPARFVGSGLTECAFRGMRNVSAESLGDRVDATARTLRRPDVRAVYLYWGEVDHLGHRHGWGSWQWGEAVELADAEIARLARQLPSGTLLLVTADHGMVDLRPDSRIDVATTPELDRDVVLIAGEPRAVHVHTAPGTAPDVAARWRDVLADSAWVLLREEAEEIELFGPLSDRHRTTVGDVVVATRGLRAVVDSRTQTPSSIALIGVHGSLTPAELEIPLLRVVV